MISCRIIDSYGVADLDQKSGLLPAASVRCQEELAGERYTALQKARSF